MPEGPRACSLGDQREAMQAQTRRKDGKELIVDDAGAVVKAPPRTIEINGAATYDALLRFAVREFSRRRRVLQSCEPSLCASA